MNHISDREKQFKLLCAEASRCQLCPRMADRKAVLSKLNGPLNPVVLFIAEAPARLGADRTRVPLLGDRSGEHFDLFLQVTGLTRNNIFITNAVLCNPRIGQRNVRPKAAEIANCRYYLQKQIEILDPPVVATLGAIALDTLDKICSHGLKLASSVGQVHDWNGRKLVPLYHPSPNVVISVRSKELQLQDYKAIREALKCQ
ncbi:MAG: uracil-DNA glycosylase [Acidobacteriota bacterium]|nr:uracil-DNA glycosylase [Blastocatellia bacterium]MDW8413133.1 uracil-DNA glycosylase [Acidobacteriota bacterium]